MAPSNSTTISSTWPSRSTKCDHTKTKASVKKPKAYNKSDALSLASHLNSQDPRITLILNFHNNTIRPKYNAWKETTREKKLCVRISQWGTHVRMLEEELLRKEGKERKGIQV